MSGVSNVPARLSAIYPVYTRTRGGDKKEEDESGSIVTTEDESLVGGFAAWGVGVGLRGVFVAVCLDGFYEFEDGGSDAGGSAAVYAASLDVEKL
jgi:hypothetical protein